MKKQVQVNLFGKNGQRSVEVTARGGFPTRHIKVPLEPVPSIFSPGTPDMVEGEQKAKHEPPPILPSSDSMFPQRKPDPVVDPAAVIEILQKMTRDDTRDLNKGWFILDEILVVATTRFGIRANQSTLLIALRSLYQQGRVAHKINRFKQHMFTLVTETPETDLHELLAEVDTLMKG